MAARREQMRWPAAGEEGHGDVNDPVASPGQPLKTTLAPQTKIKPTTTKTKTLETTTTTTSTSTSTKRRLEDKLADASELAKVEHLGRRASDLFGQQSSSCSHSRRRTILSDHTGILTQKDNKINTDLRVNKSLPDGLDQSEVAVIEGNRLATTISTIAAQTSQSRIVVALMRDGQELQLKIQEMRPGVFEVGANLAECAKYLDEHERLLKNLSKQKVGPIEAWLAKYKKLNAIQPNASAELRLIYLSMAENLQGCWRALLGQLELRLKLLDETCKFFKQTEQLAHAIELADQHVELFRCEFLDGNGSLNYNKAVNELQQLNASIASELTLAKLKQKQLIELIGQINVNNLGDLRANILVNDAQNLINFINNFIEPFEWRKIQLESVLTSGNRNTTLSSEKKRLQTMRAHNPGPNQEPTTQTLFTNNSDGVTYNAKRTSGADEPTSGGFAREISNFNDLNLADNWLNIKINQLNSSLLSSLGSSGPDTRAILNKHEQIALECSAIEEATLSFRGKNIHSIKSIDLDAREDGTLRAVRTNQTDLFVQQRVLAERTRNVITILDARITLLRRTIDFYTRARDSTSDINKMMRRLQVDNSLQSVQFVNDELELKDFSSVVASGATIISELQQLQLAQEHGHRSKIVNLNLITSGIRLIVDQLNQDLAHLKTTLNQRRLILLNEDTTKMAQNYTSKCQQLKFWLDNQIKAQLLANNRFGFNVATMNAYCDSHEELRLNLQQKTLEVEALLRLLSTLMESFNSKSRTIEEIQRDTDELRQDWINVTNCLDGRLEFARQYLAILNNLNILKCEINQLIDETGTSARSRTPEMRTSADIELTIEQLLTQLTNQVKNFTLNASKLNTTLVHARALEVKSTRHDINKQQVVGHANGALKLLSELNKTNINRMLARGPRKWANDQTDNATTTSVTRASTAATKGGQTMDANETAMMGKNGDQVSSEPTGDERQENVAPRFTRHLADMKVEPFKSCQLECELDPAYGGRECRLEWLLNNKRIPSNIKHSLANEATRHTLTIAQFGPMCCGTYTARAHNTHGQSATSTCNLRLSGIREHDESDLRESLSESPQMAPQPLIKEPPPAKKTQQIPVARPKTRWLQNGANGWQWQQQQQQQEQQEQQVSKERALERIIRGVSESPAGDNDTQLSFNDNSNSNTTTTTNNDNNNNNNNNNSMSTSAASKMIVNETANKFPVTQASYDGNLTNCLLTNRQVLVSRQPINYIDSPAPRSSTASQASRSMSTTPFEGTPQPPIFMHGLSETRASGRNSQAGLVCVVVGNPPPNVEWLHEQQLIASVKCAQPMTSSKGNICKLTIETLNDKTCGQYVCRASNRLGQTTTALTLNK